MTAEAAEALLAGWGIRAEVRAETIGVNNMTWKVGDDAWLARHDRSGIRKVAREAELYHFLATHHVHESGISTPRLISTIAGRLFHDDGRYLWRLSAHMDGEMPSQTDAALYPVIAYGLARLHGALNEVPHRYAVSETGILHVRVDARGTRVTGVLDFEFCSVDPAVLDLAATVITLLVRSGIEHPEPVVAEILQAYKEGGGEDVSADVPGAAMLVRKLDSYWYHRERYMNGRGSPETYRRQVDQLKAVMSWLDRWTDA